MWCEKSFPQALMPPMVTHQRHASQLRKAFVASKKHLAKSLPLLPGDCRFICHSLNKALSLGEIKTHEWDLARKVVQTRLMNRSSLSSWAREGGIVINKDEQKELRHAWINQLIREFGG